MLGSAYKWQKARDMDAFSAGSGLAAALAVIRVGGEMEPGRRQGYKGGCMAPSVALLVNAAVALKVRCCNVAAAGVFAYCYCGTAIAMLCSV